MEDELEHEHAVELRAPNTIYSRALVLMRDLRLCL